VLEFGLTGECDESDKYKSKTRYVEPKVHPNGYSVFMGGNDSTIKVWDMRFIKNSNDHQSLIIHEKGRVHQLGFWNDNAKTNLVSL
jgi:WD40 repeat protein